MKVPVSMTPNAVGGAGIAAIILLGVVVFAAARVLKQHSQQHDFLSFT